MAEQFGKHETASNGILALLVELGVSNAEAIRQDGNLGEQFNIALNEVRNDAGKATRLTKAFRDACRSVHESPGEHHLYSARWGSDYDKFVRYLNEGADLDKRNREAGGD